ncbi:MAG: DUF4277 domain-containing protein, partial [bacterium]|nr:DUF4277 domain-containing protein [bacterium]
MREAIEAYFPRVDPRTKVDPAQGVELLVKNSLLSREPLYGIGEWATQYDPECLGLSASQVGAINDDRVGRWLDRLFDADQGSLALHVAAHVTREFDVSLEELHNDSTTVTFSGEHADHGVGLLMRGKRVPVITHGHNKDHRPDLKQLLFVLTTSADGSVPVHFNVLDGNTTDDQTHVTTWDLLRGLRGD